MEGTALAKVHTLVLLFVCTYTVAAIYQDPRNDFFNHAVVKPTMYPVVTSRSRPGFMQTPTEEELKMEFNAFGKKFDINLKINKNLFSSKYVETYEEDGEEKVYQPINERERKCYYQGHVENVKRSWAAVSNCDGISGVFYDGKETYYVEPDRLSLTGEHLVFKASDRKAHHSKCGVNDFSLPSIMNMRFQEANEKSDRVLLKVDNKTRYVEAIIINDNSLYNKYNKNLTAVNDRSKQVVNGASALYASLNIVITILKMTTWTTGDLFDVVDDSHVTLDNFLAYRQNTLLPAEPHDNALFYTNKHFDRGVVGTAWPSRMCTKERSGVQAVDSTSVLGEVAATYAHELGHNMGMSHDSGSCSCPDRHCIMYYASTDVPPTSWSSCSTEQLDRFLRTSTANCLLNKPDKLAWF